MKNATLSEEIFHLLVIKGFDVQYCSCGGFPDCICQSDMPPLWFVQQWLREKRSIYIEVKADTTPNEILGFDVVLKSWKFPTIKIGFWKDYDEALEQGILESLKYIKK